MDAARALVGLHATDASTVFLSVAARTREPGVKVLERALYEDRTLVRMLGMRRTMFVVPVEVAPVVQAACTRAIAVQERKRTVQLFEQFGVTRDGDTWLAEVEEATMRALEAHGEATAAELARTEPRLAQQIPMAVGKAYAGKLGVSTRVLFGLAAEGRIVRGRPRGSWISTQYRWAPMDRWLDGGLPWLPTEAAQAELIRRWLAAFGPGTVDDLKWWTGLTMGEVRRAVAAVQAVEVDLDGATGLVQADDLEPVSRPEPWVGLLPALDPTPMGWTERAWYLGDLGPAVFDRSGNIGPTVWFDGRIVGGWAQRQNGEVAVRLLQDIGGEASQQVQQAAGKLSDWLGQTRVTPRFRTPLERALSS